MLRGEEKKKLSLSRLLQQHQQTPSYSNIKEVQTIETYNYTTENKTVILSQFNFYVHATAIVHFISG